MSLDPETFRDNPRCTEDIIEVTMAPTGAYDFYQSLVGVALSEIPASCSLVEVMDFVADCIRSDLTDKVKEACPDLTESDLEVGFGNVNWMGVAAHHIREFEESDIPSPNPATRNPPKSTEDVITITTSTNDITKHFQGLVAVAVAEAPGTLNQYEVMEFAGDRIKKDLIRIMMSEYEVPKDEINVDLILVDWASVAIHHARMIIDDEKPKGFFARMFGR